jgi:predicted GTPase
MADVVVINKVATAALEDVERARAITQELNPKATVIEAASPIFVENSARIRGKRVLVLEDGPTLTHGGMTFGAGLIAAKRHGAAEIVDPRSYAVGSIRDTFERYPTTGPVLPAMGYDSKQIQELAVTIRNTPADLVLIATPIDLRRLIDLEKPALRVGYELQELGEPTLDDVLRRFARAADAA